ncbi:MAG: leucine-rich repeat protein, partial [Clostridiales bacterium]|nr:leucine-rich repeat protein [Clostridiales bacterium]
RVRTTPATARYLSYPCIVTFDAGDGMMNGVNIFSVEVEKGTTVPRPTEIPQRDGYVFWGWNATGSVDDPTWKFDAERITQDITIHAVWAREYTVMFVTEEGAFDDGRNTRTVTAVYGNKITAPKLTNPDPTRELQYWRSPTGDKWDFSHDTVPNYGISLYAQWDLKDDIKKALAPFIYTKTDGGYRIDGVKDQNVSGTLTVPNVVTSIKFRAFEDCYNITSVIIDDSVTEIGRNAFQNCKSLKSVILPSGLTSIENSTFDGCSSLEQINLPDTLTELGSGAFCDCSALKSIEIPSGVTEVKNATFYGCSALQQVELGDNVTKIGSTAFYGCSALQQVELGDNVTSIGISAFNGCSALRQVNLGNNVTTIGSSAFYECSALREITMGDSVTLIDSYAFKGCSSLTSFDLPTVIEEIGEGAFEGCASLKSIIIPVACQNVGAYAFKDCTGITSVELHFAAVYGNNVFDGCTALTDYILGDEVLQLGAATFQNYTNLRSVTIGDGLTEIPSYAFRNCYNLRNVSIGSGVKEIKSHAFDGCVLLFSITIPSNVETVASNAFYGCSNLMEVYNLSNASLSFDSYVTVHTDASEESVVHYTDDDFLFVTINDKPTLFKYLGDKADIVLPDDCNGESYSIYDRALAYHPQLNSVKFSAGVKEIGYDILLGSDNVTSLTVDSANPIYSSSGNCVIKPNSQELILCCKTSVIPDDGSVRSIMSNVFCHNATIVNDSFRIPDSVQWVYRYAFDGCYGLMRTADNGVVYVDRWVYAFDCDNSGELVDIELDAGTVGICNAAFYRGNTSSSISVRNAIRSLKFNAELKYVGNGAFACCENLTEIIMNDGLLSIMNDAFYGCKKLQDVVVPDSVYFLGPNAFNLCANLKYVKLPASSNVVQQELFSGCETLESVVIPQTVSLIGQGMLLGCPDTVVVYYEGAEEQWSAVTIKENNDVLNNATKYYYSETEIEGVNCWHYGADGKPTTEY